MKYAEAVKKANKDHSFPRMKYLQKEREPWLSGFSNILREWIQKVSAVYIQCATMYPKAVFKAREEMQRNMTFMRLGYDHYLKLLISRLT